MLQGWIQIALTLLIVLIMTPILGRYIARIFLGERTVLDLVLMPLEQLLYRFSGIRPQSEMTGWQYIRAVLISNLVMAILV